MFVAIVDDNNAHLRLSLPRAFITLPMEMTSQNVRQIVKFWYSVEKGVVILMTVFAVDMDEDMPVFRAFQADDNQPLVT